MLSDRSPDGYDVRDAKTWRTIVLGTASGATGWAIAISIYLAPESVRTLPLLFLIFSPFLVWLGGHLLVSPILREWRGWKKALLVSILYVAIGAVLVTVAADARGFSGVPPFFPLIWPIGYVFILFSERLFDVSELYHLLWVGLGIILSLGLVSAGLLWFRERMGGYPIPG